MDKISHLLDNEPDGTSAKAVAAPKEHAVAVQVWQVKLEAASNDFNQQIPAIRPVQLDNIKILDEKMKMLDTLDDIAVAQQLGVNASVAAGGGCSSGAASVGPKHPLDAQAEQLTCSIMPLKHSSKVFKAIQKAAKNSAEPTARLANQLCGFHHFRETPEVLDVYELDRDGEEDQYVVTILPPPPPPPNSNPIYGGRNTPAVSSATFC